MDSALAIGGTDQDAGILLEAGFTEVTVLNIYKEAISKYSDRVAFLVGDVRNNNIADRSFDIVFASDCLHHCRYPHGALCEAYRIARKLVVIVESRDSFVIRLAERLGIAMRFEIIPDNLRGRGGVDYSEVPNFVYRWTEREFEKTIRSYDPTIEQNFVYHYDANLPVKRLPSLNSRLFGLLGHLMKAAAFVVKAMFPHQGNTFAMVAVKDPVRCALQPWLERRDDRVRPRLSFYRDRFGVSVDRAGGADDAAPSAGERSAGQTPCP